MIDEYQRSPERDTTDASSGPHSYVSFHPGRNGGGGGGKHVHARGDGASTVDTLLIGQSKTAHFTLVYNAKSHNYTLSTGNAIGPLAETIVFTSDVEIRVTSAIEALRDVMTDPPALELRDDGNGSVKWIGLADVYAVAVLDNGYHTLVTKPGQDGRGVVILLTPYPIELADAIPKRAM